MQKFIKNPLSAVTNQHTDLAPQLHLLPTWDSRPANIRNKQMAKGKHKNMINGLGDGIAGSAVLVLSGLQILLYRGVGDALLNWGGYLSFEPEEKMFGFHKPKMYRSIEGCCICRAKSSSSRFTDSKRYEKDFQSCFGLHETRSGDICNACVLLVKRWKKLPAGSKKNWNHVVDARAGPSLKTTLKPKKVKALSGNRMKSSQISKLQKEFKRHNFDAHSTTSSASPAQSPCYSNQSDEGSDTEMASSSNRTPVFSFLDLTYWKRQKICCGIIYKGRFGEVLIDTHLFKPCCSSKKAAAEKPEERWPAPLPISTQEW